MAPRVSEDAGDRLQRAVKGRMEDHHAAREQHDRGQPELDGERHGLAQEDPAGSSPRVATDARVPAVVSIA